MNVVAIRRQSAKRDVATKPKDKGVQSSGRVRNGGITLEFTKMAFVGIEESIISETVESPRISRGR